jgi:hypothetical protein
MSALSDYKAQKQALAEAESFLSLLQGGAAVSECEFTINRAEQPPVKMPDSMKTAVYGIVASRANQILTAVVAKMRTDLQAAAIAARDEYRQLLLEEGITP